MRDRLWRLRRLLLDLTCWLDGHDWYSTFYCRVDPRCRTCRRCGKSQHADDEATRAALAINVSAA